MTQSATESYWNQQKDTLLRVRSRESQNSRGTKRGFEPLSDKHRLLAGSHASRAKAQTPPRGRKSFTPPAHLPRLETPPEYKHESRVRGVRFGVLPNVQRSWRNDDDEDSWGEEEESDEEAYPGYPQLPYTYPGSKLPMPVVMYPMILPPQPAPRRSKDKGKKRVRMRNSPVYLNSRDNTLHEPQFVHNQAQPAEPRYSYDERLNGYADDDSHLGYISAQRGSHYDPFDPNLNPVLARYSVNVDRDEAPSYSKNYRKSQARSIYEHFTSDYLFARKFTEDLLADLILEDDLITQVVYDVLTDPNLDHLKHIKSPLVTHSDPPDGYTSLGRELVLETVVEDLINEHLQVSLLPQVVTSSMDDYVTDYMNKAAVYDVATDLVTEVIEEYDGPDIASEAMLDVFFEEWLRENVLEPEMADMTQEVIMEVCNTYNDKMRQRDIRQIKKDYGGKMLDSLYLDYLLLFLARQGLIWTETEHVGKIFDGLLLSLLLEQLDDVTKERRNDINNKPVRRHHEKMVTDVAVEVLLSELCPSLDEDMADLDEYEMGLQFNLNASCTTQAVEVLLSELCPSLDEDMADLDEYEMGMQFNLNTDSGDTLANL